MAPDHPTGMRARPCSARGPAGCGRAGAAAPQQPRAHRSSGRAALPAAARPAKEPRAPRLCARAAATDVSGELARRAPAGAGALTLDPPARSPDAARATVRRAGDADFDQVGWLRARAYYEDKPAGRFQGSFTKQFAEQEARSLGGRTRAPPGAVVPEAACLVASRSGGDAAVIASADVRPPACAGGRYPDGLPQGSFEDLEGAYILNVVVESRWRREGLGRLIMTAAEQHAAMRWGAKRAYAHVSLGNKAAWQLYSGLGYEAHGAHCGNGAPAGVPGNVLLCKNLARPHILSQ